MARLWQTITDWETGKDTLRRRRYGVIETAGGQLVAIHFRPYPKLFAWLDPGAAYDAAHHDDRCLLYYNQPLRFPNFIALKYVESKFGTSYATFRAALVTLDAIAQLKQTDALLCDAYNKRLSDRFLRRQGWEPHKPQRWHRNFIKRFYGEYPLVDAPTFQNLAPVESVAHC